VPLPHYPEPTCNLSPPTGQPYPATRGRDLTFDRKCHPTHEPGKISTNDISNREWVWQPGTKQPVPEIPAQKETSIFYCKK